MTAHTLVDVLVLTKADLESIVADYPVLLTQMLEVAAQRLAELGEVARITSFSKAIGVACLTKISTTRWLKRVQGSKAPPTASPTKVDAAGEEHPAEDGGANGAAANVPAAEDAAVVAAQQVHDQMASAATRAEVAQLMAAVTSMATEMAALRREVSEMREDAASSKPGCG